jgi:Predicted transcriptional regulator
MSAILCPKCNRPYEVSEATFDHPYQYSESGLSGIQLIGVTVYSCPNCEVESADIPHMNCLHNLIAKDIILTPLPMSGKELRFLRKETNLKPKEFAERLGVDPKTIGNWETSDKLSRQVDTLVRLFVSMELWQGQDMIKTLEQLADLLKYDWEEEADLSVAQLALVNTILGLNDKQEWDFPKAA